MAYSIQEQEEIEGFKHFWRSGGAMLFALILLAVLGFFGWKFYQNSQVKQRNQAGVELSEFMKEFSAQKFDEAGKRQQTLKVNYKNTPAAATATLAMAGAHFEAKKYSEAETEIKWVLANTKDETIVALATQRLANLYLQEKKYDLALEAITKPVTAKFEGMSYDIKGDIFYAQNKMKEALEAYEFALARLPEGVAAREIVELKRDQTKMKL